MKDLTSAWREALKTAAIVVTIGAALGIAGGINYNNQQKEIEKIKSGLELKTGYYNNNAILDKYYEIKGIQVPFEIDGKPVRDYFK
jgi:hypothetical protein